MKNKVNGVALIIYALILIMLIVLIVGYSKGETEEPNSQMPTSKQAWQTEERHLQETLSTLRMNDKGITAIDHRLKSHTMATGNHFKELHSVRAKYIENRITILFHLHNLTPPLYEPDIE